MHTFYKILFPFLICVSFVASELLLVDHIRAEVIALESHLWDKIQNENENNNMEKRNQLLNYILNHHYKIIFSNKNSLLQENWTRDHFFPLHIIPEWLKVECDILLLSKHFEDFEELLKKTEYQNVGEFMNEIQYFVDDTLSSSIFDMSDLLERLLKLIENDSVSNFYDVVKLVSL